MNQAYMEQLFSLEGQNAVVTGASSGIGRAIAVSLANMGANVALLGRSKKGLALTRDQVQANGGSCEEYIVDISDTDAQRDFFETWMESHKTIDIFVANAGVNIRSELPDATLDDINEMVRTDYIGTLYGMILCSDYMKRQRSGNIVVITSINGVSPLPNQAVYSSIKCALESAMQSLSVSMAEYGVRVNSIAPGCIRTAINDHIFSVEEYRKGKEAEIPMGKIGTPEDIGDAVAAIVSDAFRFMTGNTVIVDGGELKRKKMKQPPLLS
ncbi:MAG: SDR family oxidoreductase [Lachnospiraceae bacterium]|nr:SDR family oxidoreductase [Lachnospiraceae bacterium]